MNILLNLLSQSSAILFATGIIYLALSATIGKIKWINHEKFIMGIQIKELVFLVVSLMIVIVFFDAIKPY